MVKRDTMASQAETKARELGARVPADHGGMNWTWSIGFPDYATASAFVAWLDINGYEHRGVYQTPSAHCDVRWRK